MLQYENDVYIYLTENTSMRYHTNYKFNTPGVDTERPNQVGLMSELIILGVAAAILSMLYCIFRLRK